MLYGGAITFGVEVPENWTPIRAAQGHIIGFRTPDGSEVKPWLSWERNELDVSDSDLENEGLTYGYRTRELRVEE